MSIDLAFNRNQPRWPKGHPLAGQWRGRGLIAKAMLKAADPREQMEREAEEFYRKFADPKPGDQVVVNFGFGDWRLTYSKSGMWNREVKSIGRDEWVKAPQPVPGDMLDTFLRQGNAGYPMSEAYKKFIGIDPDKFLKRREVTYLPDGIIQTTPDVAYEHEPELARMLWDPNNVPFLIFQTPDKDIIRVLDDERFTDKEIRTFLSNTKAALDLAAGASDSIRSKPVDVVVHSAWDEDDGIKGYVRPVIPDIVNINPSTLKNEDTTRWDGYWGAVNPEGHFVHQGETVDPQTYFVLHELGHIADARSGHTSGLGPAAGMRAGQISDREGLWHSDIVGEEHSIYGQNNAAEGYAEAFAQWALYQRDGHQYPKWLQETKYLNDDSEVSKMILLARAKKRRLAEIARARADRHLQIATLYAERYGWKGYEAV